MIETTFSKNKLTNILGIRKTTLIDKEKIKLSNGCYNFNHGF
jgi:hypothetical protein